MEPLALSPLFLYFVLSLVPVQSEVRSGSNTEGKTALQKSTGVECVSESGISGHRVQINGKVIKDEYEERKPFLTCKEVPPMDVDNRRCIVRTCSLNKNELDL